MFGAQNENNQDDKKSEVVFNPSTIPTHIMQDDLDILSGKVKAPSPASSENSRSASTAASGREADQASAGGFSGSSPFLGNPVPPATSPANVSSNEKPMSSIQIPSSAPKEIFEEATDWGKAVGILAIVFIALGVLGGGYYFYMTRYNNQPVEPSQQSPANSIPENIPEKAPAEIIVPEKFSADKPNYLMVDAEKATMENLQKLFLQKAIEIQDDGKTAPVEFVVTDLNNNPIAFKIFALLMKINLSSSLLSNLQDEFSIHIFSDEGRTRLGLEITPKDAAKILSGMKAEEKTLVKNVAPLFLGETAKSSSALFRDSQYNNANIRYLNLNDQNSLSIDYALVENQLLVATSKNTERAIIDKIADLSQ